MLEFLRDPFWQFVGAVFALGAIAVSVVLYFLQRRHKALSYEIVSRTPLMSVKEEVKGRVQILLDGTPVSDAHMVIIRVTNSGNVPIIPSDYLRPVHFDFGETVQILSAEITETNPDNVDASLELGSETVVLTPVLLNGGDSIILKVLVAEFAGKIDVDGRIIGVKRIQIARESRLPYAAMLIGVITTMVGFTSLFGGSEQIGLLGAFVGYGLMFVGMLSRQRYRRLLIRTIRTYKALFE